jgi:hypothetical protein
VFLFPADDLAGLFPAGPPKFGPVRWTSAGEHERSLVLAAPPVSPATDPPRPATS